MRKLLLLLCLVTLPGFAETVKFADGTSLEIPSTFEKSSVAPLETWGAWTHKNDWKITIETKEGDSSEAASSRASWTGSGVKVSDVSVPGAQAAFRLDFEAPKRRVEIRAWGSHKRAAVLTIENDEGKSPEGFNVVVERVAKSLKMGAPAAGSSAWGAKGTSGGAGGDLGLSESALKAQAKTSTLKDYYTDSAYHFRVYYDASGKVDMVEFLKKADGSELGYLDVNEIKKRYKGSFSKKEVGKMDFWVGKSVILRVIQVGKRYMVTAYTTERYEKEVQAGKASKLP